ncbi:MAG: hypothetical protein JWO55_332 [Candidatus Saccharibacteria bacterium]|jgi:hypothetical protein|nr:hypothetical protein [Candidatus Saccharibacteria bacterium]
MRFAARHPESRGGRQTTQGITIRVDQFLLAGLLQVLLNCGKPKYVNEGYAGSDVLEVTGDILYVDDWCRRIVVPNGHVAKLLMDRIVRIDDLFFGHQPLFLQATQDDVTLSVDSIAKKVDLLYLARSCCLKYGSSPSVNVPVFFCPEVTLLPPSSHRIYPHFEYVYHLAVFEFGSQERMYKNNR